MYNIINCKALLEELKCKQCSKFLSVLPIYYCSAVGNICGRCVSTVDWMISNGTLERAVAYEAVAKFLIFPCANYSNGCQQKLRVDEVEQHEKMCAAVPVRCPFNVELGITSLKCDWKGTAVTVSAHLNTEHKDALQVGLPVFVMNVFDTNVKHFFTTLEGQTFLLVSKYVKDVNKFYFTVMCCDTEPNQRCYRFQLEIGRHNDYFLIFRKPNLERFSDVQNMIDNPENMISVDVASLLTMLDDPSGLIYCKVGISKKTKKEIAEITGKPDPPTPNQNNPKPKPKKFPGPAGGPPVKPKNKFTPKPKTPNVNVGEPSQVKIPPLMPEQPAKNRSKFLEELECPVCNLYMVPPIFICPTGHSLCNKCKQKLNTCPTCRVPMQDTRNFTLEKLTATVRYPCCYTDYGCTVVLQADHIKIHELHCNYAYGKCPMKFVAACDSNDVVDVVGHIREKHPHMYIEPNRQYARDIGSVVTTSYWATSVDGQIFVICCKHSNTTGPIKFCALHVGLNSKTKQKFRFRLEFCDQTSNGLRFIVSQLCKEFPQNPSAALKNCFAIPLDMLEPFIVKKPNPRLFFKIYMEKM
ncbi:hypothetical protein PPYR_14090 [Photinus pyralis]|uniref:RING-type E3 ubiquitin transferase n=1 Tax=Photinus pyralis TaxID=7054 RepID=A0A1Y1MFP2_PHOPY|nr:hypothetical protein PPYR_14090 [Photinus pyralis]